MNTINNPHPSFAARPNYIEVTNTSLNSLRERANQALKAGHLNLSTLWWHRACLLRSGQAIDLLNYLLCRRQLGYPLSARNQLRVEKLLRSPSWWLYHKGIRRHQQNQLKSLLNEARQGQAAAGPERRVIGYWLRQQATWQHQWVQQLSSAALVHVVGNSPNLLEQGLGHQIDDADIVLRFNHFKSEHTHSADTGSKLSAWVAAPGYQGPTPSLHQANTQQGNFVPLIIAGPAMLYLQQRVSHLLTDPVLYKQTPALQVPLEVWRVQVRRFAAPPSAGALAIAWVLWLKQHYNLTFTLKGFGFGYQQQGQTRYHIAKPDHRPVSRHNWEAEHQWMRSILTQ